MTAPEMHQKIAETRKVAYSTVKTIIDRLEEKKAVHRQRTYGRTILYAHLVEKDALSRPMVHSFIEKLFPGSLRPLFNHILEEDKISLEDVDYLEQVLAAKRKNLES